MKIDLTGKNWGQLLIIPPDLLPEVDTIEFHEDGIASTVILVTKDGRRFKSSKGKWNTTCKLCQIDPLQTASLVL